MLYLFLLELTPQQEEFFDCYEYHKIGFVVAAKNEKNARRMAYDDVSDLGGDKNKGMWLCGADCTKIGRANRDAIKKEGILLISDIGE